MWISSLFQTGMRKLLILGLVSSLAACGGGGGGGKQPDPVPPGSSPVSSSSSSALSSSLGSSSISSLGNSSSSATSSAADTTPDSFSFPAVTGSPLNVNVTSAVVIISGINTAVPISIANGEYSIDGGAFTSAAGMVSNGQTVALRIESAATVAEETQATVTIGGITRSFSVTTINLLGGAIQGTPLNLAGAVITIAGVAPSADGKGTAARFNSPSGSVSDGTYLYVADTGNNKIRKIEIATGIVTALAGSGSEGSTDGIGVAASFGVPSGIATDGAHLYVGDCNNNKIRKIEVATGVVSTLAGSGAGGSADGIGATASFNCPLGITTDSTYLYVVDTGNFKIRKIAMATGIVTTLAGSGLYGSADGIGAMASFSYPQGITSSAAYLYVADSYSHKIRRIEIATSIVTTLAGSGSRGSVDGIRAAASFYHPNSITTDGTYLYVTDALNHKVRKIEIETGVVTSFAGSGSKGFSDGAGAMASFNQPSGISIYGSHLYIADTENEIIRKIVIATGVVSTLAGGNSLGGDGTGAAVSFKTPSGIITDGIHLYVADTENHKIRKIEVATGVVATLAGSGSEGSDDGTGGAASFKNPNSITSDGTHLYVADTYNHKIRQIEMATGVVTTLAGSGSEGSDDGTGGAASFKNPNSITIDGTHLYVADTGNHKIRKIEIATGAVTTLAGSGSYDSADGTGAMASFGSPRGITTDGAHLYVTDSDYSKIRKIEIATSVVTTLAGTGSDGSADGTGAAASFYYPQGVTTDGTHLYITDSGNNKIRKIEIATGLVTTLAGSDSVGSDDGIATAAKFNNPTGITTDGFALYVTDSNNNTIRKIE